METELEAIKRINQPFFDLEHYTHATVQGFVRGLLVVGDPGLGKSFHTDKVLDIYRDMDKSGLERFEVIGGTISTPFIYRKLYEFRQKGMVLIFDVCKVDEEEGWNLLKHALDSGDKRTLAWYKESAWLKREKMPPKFEFEGSVIYLTNTDLMNVGGKLQDHIDAIISRSHYLDMRMASDADRILRIKSVVNDSGMLASHGLSAREVAEVLGYIEDNADTMRELSLRIAKKTADLYVAFPDNWRGLADRGCRLSGKALTKKLLDNVKAGK